MLKKSKENNSTQSGDHGLLTQCRSKGKINWGGGVREIKFYFQHFIQVCFYFLGKELGGPGPFPYFPLLFDTVMHDNDEGNILNESPNFVRRENLNLL